MLNNELSFIIERGEENNVRFCVKLLFKLVREIEYFMVADKFDMEEVFASIFLSHKHGELVIFNVLGSIYNLLLDNKLLIFLFFPGLLLFPSVLKLLLFNNSHFLVFEEGSHRNFAMVSEQFHYLAVVEKMADPLVTEKTED